MDMRQLGLAIVGFDPFLVLIHDADERLTGVDQFADIDVPRAHKTRVRGDDVTIGEIEFGQLHRRLCQFNCGFHRRAVMTRFIRHAALHVNGVTDLFVTRLRGKISRVRLVGYLLCDRTRPKQLLAAFVLACEVVQIGFRLGFGSFGSRDVRGGSANRRTGLFALLLGTRQIALGLRQTKTKLAA